MKNLLLIILVLFISGCQRKTTELPAKYQSFLNLTYELIQMEKQCKTDSAYIDSSSILFSEYQIDRDVYNQTMHYFDTHPEQWHLFFNQLEKMQQDSGKSILK